MYISTHSTESPLFSPLKIASNSASKSPHYTAYVNTLAKSHTRAYEKQETDTDTKSGNEHGKWKILHTQTTGIKA